MIKIGNAMDVLKAMDGGKVHAVITSPPYWGLRAYGTNPQVWDDGWVGELGSEPSPELFIEHIANIFDEVKRVLRPDGVCWINIGDSYVRDYMEGLKPKDLFLIPQRLVIELQRRGWWIRSYFTWWKGSAMPESCKDRPANSHEWIIMATKRKSYWYDIDAERVGRTEGSLARWKVAGDTCKRIKGRATEDHRGTSFDTNLGLANRNLRTGDFMQMSLDAEIEQVRQYLDYLHGIKRKGGIINDDEGTPTGLFCNPKGFKGAHFATFPPRFVEILTNLSVPKKACAECGTGWKQTIGFCPDCECDADHRLDADKICTVCGANSFKSAVEPCWISGVVLDPFIGAGTVGLVAQRLGRQWIGIELSEIYAAMADKRIESENQLDIF